MLEEARKQIAAKQERSHDLQTAMDTPSSSFWATWVTFVKILHRDRARDDLSANLPRTAVKKISFTSCKTHMKSCTGISCLKCFLTGESNRDGYAEISSCTCSIASP